MANIKKMFLAGLLSLTCLGGVACVGQEDYTYSVTITQEGNGNCRSTLDSVQFGGTVEFSIKPDNYHQIKEFSVNGTVIPVSGTTHIEYCVTQDLEVKVVFEYALIKVTYNAGDVDVNIPIRYVTKNAYYGFMPDLRKINDENSTIDEDVNHYYCLEDDQVFVGWYTEPNGQGKHIMGGCFAPEYDHTLYAYIKTVE